MWADKRKAHVNDDTCMHPSNALAFKGKSGGLCCGKMQLENEAIKIFETSSVIFKKSL